MGHNTTVLAVFRELIELTTLSEGSPQSFRVRAYERAAAALAAETRDLSTLSLAQLKKIAGVGASAAAKVREVVETGELNSVAALRERFPPDVVALSRVPGVGPKTVARLRDELDVHSIDDLEAAIAANRLRDLPGLGAKTEEKLSRTLARVRRAGTMYRAPIARALPLAEGLAAALRALPEVQRVEICGSLRRYRETIGDVDLLVVSEEPLRVMAAFVALPEVQDVVVMGPSKTSVVVRGDLQVDLRVVEAHQLGAAMMYFTGSKEHNILLRQRALARGWSLNEYGLTDTATGELVACATEEEVYGALQLPFIPAPMRQGAGELDAAEAGELPDLVAVDDLKGDLHVHSTWSGDGRSPLADVVAAAEARGYRYFSLTEHAEDLVMNGLDREQLLRQREELMALQEQHPGVHLLWGVELNIGRDGGLDYDPAFRAQLDWVVAAVHSHFDLTQAAQTRRILAAIADPHVDAIGHLSGRMIGKRPGMDLDIEEILQALVHSGTALELNAALPRLDAASEVLRRAGELGVTMVMSTDSHHVRQFDRMRHGVQWATRGWVDKRHVANTWPKERFLGWLRDRRASAGVA